MLTAVASAMSELMDFAGDSGTYTPNGGAPVLCQIRIDRSEYEEPTDMETVSSGKEIRAKALIDEIGQLPTGKTRNTPGDMFVVSEGPDAGTYEVTEMVERNNHFVICAVLEV
jgi:hypothetical protein